MKSYKRQFLPWMPGFFIFDNANIHSNVIAEHALSTKDDDELSVCMKQLTAIKCVDSVLFKLVLSEGNL